MDGNWELGRGMGNGMGMGGMCWGVALASVWALGVRLGGVRIGQLEIDFILSLLLCASSTIWEM
jgi:hypothetical protein